AAPPEGTQPGVFAGGLLAPPSGVVDRPASFLLGIPVAGAGVRAGRDVKIRTDIKNATVILTGKQFADLAPNVSAGRDVKINTRIKNSTILVMNGQPFPPAQPASSPLDPFPTAGQIVPEKVS